METRGTIFSLQSSVMSKVSHVLVVSTVAHFQGKAKAMENWLSSDDFPYIGYKSIHVCVLLHGKINDLAASLCNSRSRDPSSSKSQGENHTLKWQFSTIVSVLAAS